MLPPPGSSSFSTHNRSGSNILSITAKKYMAIFASLFLFVIFFHQAILGSSESKSILQQTQSELDIKFDQKVDEAVRHELEKQIANINLSRENKLFPSVKKLLATEKKRIVVTGGAGFVGSHLVDRLMYQGHEVIVVDNFFTGRRENVEHWIGHKNFRLVNHDVVEPFMVEADQIYHLACPASPPHYQYNPIKTIKTSVEGTLNMLGLAKRLRARILLASTSEVYGDPEEHPQKETYFGNVNPIGPRACYDEGKRVAETMMYSYQRQENVDVRVARIFNTFGPRMHPNDGRVVSNFIIQALQKKPITVYGSGMQTRSFQFVDDLVDGLVKLMNSNYTLPVNIGNPDEYTIQQFAKLIQGLVDPDVPVVNLPGTKDDPRKRKPDISVAKQYINWQPRVNVQDGLKKTIDYFKQQLEETGEFNPIKPQELEHY